MGGFTLFVCDSAKYFLPTVCAKCDSINVIYDIVEIESDVETIESETEGVYLGPNWSKVCCKKNKLVPYWLFLSKTDKHTISYRKLLEYSDKAHTLTLFINYLKKTHKLALFFGNCQMGPIKKIVEKSNFIDDYYIIDHPGIHLSNNVEKEKGLDATIMSKVDLFVCHNISKNNIFSPMLSTSVLKSQISEKCKSYIITNLWYDGYFPLLTKLDDNIFLRPEVCPRTSIPDLVEMYRSGKTDEEIAYELENYDIDRERILTAHTSAIKRLRDREKNCDVVAADFIEDNYQIVRLFHTENHPIRELIIEVTNRFLKKIGYAPVVDCCLDVPEIDSIQLYIPPVVKKTLDLKFEDSMLYWIKSINPRPLSLLERIRFIRFFLAPESRVKSFDWIYNSPKTLNLTPTIKYGTNIRPLSCVFTINAGTVHLSLRYTMSKKAANIQIIQFPAEYSPSAAYCSTSISTKMNAMTVIGKGEVLVTSNSNEEDEYILDTTWSIS